MIHFAQCLKKGPALSALQKIDCSLLHEKQQLSQSVMQIKQSCISVQTLYRWHQKLETDFSAMIIAVSLSNHTILKNSFLLDVSFT